MAIYQSCDVTYAASSRNIPVFLCIAAPSTAALLCKKSCPPGHPVTAAVLHSFIQYSV